MSQNRTSTAAIDRREFARRGSLAAGGWLLLSSTGRAQGNAANDKLNLGFIGTGGMGCMHLDWFRQRPDVAVIAVCDVDSSHLANAKKMVPSAAATGDFREVVGRDDIDAVVVATPDHWHALVSVAAAKAGKHVYCEKPLANSIGESRAIADAVAKAGVVLQTGSHERSNRGASIARQAFLDGRLGDVKTVVIRLPNSDPHLQQVENFTSPPPNSEPPKSLDYDFWLGHTPVVPYNTARSHFWWRFDSHYGGGEITDRGAHVIDMAHYVLGLDDTGPTKVKANGKPPAGNFYDAFITFEFENEYPNGMIMRGNNEGPRGVVLQGTEGQLEIAIHGCALTPDRPELLAGLDAPQVDPNATHRETWLRAIRGDGKVVAPANAGHHTATACQLTNIAMRLGKPIEWDPATETSPDAEVMAQLMPEMRSPWTLS